MTDEVTYTEAGRTYRVRGLQAKARSVFEASQELDDMIADRLSAGRKALEHWRGPHAVTYANELNGVLAKMAGLKLTLWQAQTTLERFPEAGSWGSGRYGEEIAASARVDVPIAPGTVSAETDQLRRYATTASGQDERLSVLATTVNLDGVSAEITYQRPVIEDTRTEPIDVAILVTLPRPGDQLPALTSASNELNIFTWAVATALDHADGPALALLASDPRALPAQLAWLRGDPTRRWTALTASQRWMLIHAVPQQIGSMDGIPALDRDQANRIVLRQAKADLRARRDRLRALGGDEDEIARINERLGGIEAIERRLRLKAGRPPAYLLGLRADGTGRAIVAIGNPDTADNVATLVPGANNALNGDDMRRGMRRAGAMVADAGRLQPGSATSAIMWLGYEPPEADVLPPGPSHAEQAAPALRSFQAGLASTNITGNANHTVIGHSYGATVAGHAARGPGLEADNLVFVGTDHVFATTARHDGLAGGAEVATLDPGPTGQRFGAHVFPSDDGSPWSPKTVHSSYWHGGNEARANMAAIITGRYGEVGTVPPPENQLPTGP